MFAKITHILKMLVIKQFQKFNRFKKKLIIAILNIFFKLLKCS